MILINNELNFLILICFFVSSFHVIFILRSIIQIDPDPDKRGSTVICVIFSVIFHLYLFSAGKRVGTAELDVQIGSV